MVTDPLVIKTDQLLSVVSLGAHQSTLPKGFDVFVEVGVVAVTAQSPIGQSGRLIFEVDSWQLLGKHGGGGVRFIPRLRKQSIP